MVKTKVDKIHLRGDYSDREIIDFLNEDFKHKFGKSLTIGQFKVVARFVQQALRQDSMTPSQVSKLIDKAYSICETIKESGLEVSYENAQKLLIKDKMNELIKGESA